MGLYGSVWDTTSCQVDVYSKPQFDKLLVQLGTACFFTTLDLTMGYCVRESLRQEGS